MIAVIFEVTPAEGESATYLDQAAALRGALEAVPGFLSVERFSSLTEPGKVLSLSFFETEEAVREWRNNPQHRFAQALGRDGVFSAYRLRVAHVLRDYGCLRAIRPPQTAAPCWGNAQSVSAGGLLPPQCAMNTGTSACSSILRVAPPRIASRKREWP